MSNQYFAQLDNENIVISVHVVTAEYMAENPELYPGVWVETFIDDPDKTYAAIGYIYDYETQDFTSPPPKPDPIPEA
jgi:hypothetical protein